MGKNGSEAVSLFNIEALEKYVGGPVRIWLEDVSGEEKTKPKTYSLHKVERTPDGFVKFYTGASQFVAVPTFGGEGKSACVGALDSVTELVEDEATPRFVSKDAGAQLVYWVHFAS
ncbi:hypothetical protein MO973_13355 [Paenibacillus sp. TRM 82003]|nr:hypothetical protein [Paenibacillus sp. TRM 82003]